MNRIMGKSSELEQEWYAMSPKGNDPTNHIPKHLTERFPLLGAAAAENTPRSEFTNDWFVYFYVF